MARLKLEFERGGQLVADIFGNTSETWRLLKAALPATVTGYNARWSGRDSYAPRAGIGDLIYACEREERDHTGFGGVGWFYGAETLQDWRRPFAVNHIGRIDPSQWAKIEEIGLRIWRQGGEKITLSALD